MSYTDQLTPEDRLKRIAEILADAALRLHRKQAGQGTAEPAISGSGPSQPATSNQAVTPKPRNSGA